MQEELKIKKDFKTINEDEEISKLISQFDKNITSFIVLDKNNNYSGVLQQKDVMRSATLLGKVKVKSLKTNAPKVSQDVSINECARLMIENDIMTLPVIKDNKIIGVIEYTYILKSLPKDIMDSEIKEYMSINMITADPKQKISQAISTMKDNQISRLPIIENNKLVGLITIHDIVSNSFFPKKRQNLGYIMNEKRSILDLPIKNLMVSRVITDFESAKVDAIVDKFIENRINSVVIIDNSHKLKGIVTRKDLLEPVARIKEETMIPKIYVGSKVRNIDRKRVADILINYSKNREHLKKSRFNVYITEHKESFRDQEHNMLYVKLRIHSPAGRFIAAAKGWGIENMMKNVLEKIDKQIERNLETNSISKEKVFRDDKKVKEIKKMNK